MTRTVRMVVLAAAFALTIANAGWSRVAAQAGVSVSGSVSAGGQRDLSGVAVWLQPLDAHGPNHLAGSSTRFVMKQQNKRFTPHILVVPVGTSVDFPNLDPFFHNVFSLFDGRKFDLGLYEAGSSRSIAFPRAGVSYVFCNIHPDMSAVVVAVDTPHFTSTDRLGIFSIPHVPPGRYVLNLWHDRLSVRSPSDPSPIQVTVGPADTKLGTFALVQGDDKLSPHTNKFGQPYAPPPSGPVYK